jgi:predicted dehydrogenase
MIEVLLAGFAGLGDQDHQSAMYLPALTGHDGFRIAAVCASGEADLPVAQRVSTDLGVPLIAGLDAALATPGIDLVSVAVPLDQRRDAITKCLRAGKHVLADKPLAGTLPDVTAILDVVGDRVLLPAHHQRWNGALQSARAAVAAGRIGLPWNVQVDFLVAGGAPVPDGELLNFAVYPVDAIRALLGLNAVRVQASSASRWHDAVDDFATLLIDYDNGVTGTIALGRTREIHDAAPGSLIRHRYRISGSHGTLVVDATRPGIAVRTATDNHSSWVGAGTVAAMVADLHRAIGSGRSPIPPADVLDTYRIVDAAQRSLRAGNPCEIA